MWATKNYFQTPRKKKIQFKQTVFQLLFFEATKRDEISLPACVTLSKDSKIEINKITAREFSNTIPHDRSQPHHKTFSWQKISYWWWWAKEMRKIIGWVEWEDDVHPSLKVFTQHPNNITKDWYLMRATTTHTSKLWMNLKCNLNVPKRKTCMNVCEQKLKLWWWNILGWQQISNYVDMTESKRERVWHERTNERTNFMKSIKTLEISACRKLFSVHAPFSAQFFLKKETFFYSHSPVVIRHHTERQQIE